MDPTKSTEPADRDGLRAITAMMRKPREPFWISELFFRPWTVYISAVLVQLRLSANTVTAASMLCIVAGAFLLMTQTPGNWLIGIVLIFVYWVCDHCDGEMARYYRLSGRNRGGPEGVYWDGVAHGFEAVLMGFVAYRVYLEIGQNVWPLLLAVGALTGGCIAPWHRYCEVLLGWAKSESGGSDHLEIQLGPHLLESQEPHEAPHYQPEEDKARWPWLAWVKQSVLYPGYYITLFIAVILDVTIGPIALSTDSASVAAGAGGEIGTAAAGELHWIGLWLIQICAGKILATIRSTYRYARRLRSVR